MNYLHLTKKARNIFTYSVTPTGSSSQAIGAQPNNNRIGLIFINPGSSVTVFVCQAFDNNQNALSAVVNGAGSIPIIPGGILSIDSDDQRAWNCIGSGGVLTVLELLS